MVALDSAHPDGASAVIIKAVWNRLHGLPLDHHQKVVIDRHACERCGAETRVERLSEETPSAPPGLICRKCAGETSPEKQQEQRDNEIARAAFDEAKRLGEAIHQAYVASRPEQGSLWHRRLSAPSNDQALLRAARDLYVTDETFRTSWNGVHGEEPGPAHLSWLRLWKRL